LREELTKQVNTFIKQSVMNYIKRDENDKSSRQQQEQRDFQYERYFNEARKKLSVSSKKKVINCNNDSLSTLR
jgi:hypothetical protein